MFCLLGDETAEEGLWPEFARKEDIVFMGPLSLQLYGPVKLRASVGFYFLGFLF
jgi:hypothetical protein